MSCANSQRHCRVFTGSPPDGWPNRYLRKEIIRLSPLSCIAQRRGKFPSYPFGYMTWSQTPAVSRTLAVAQPGLLPSTALKASAFLLHCRIYPLCPQLYIFRGSISRHGVTPLILPALPPTAGLPGLHVDFTAGLVANLWPGGNFTFGDHPLGNDNEFHPALAGIPTIRASLGATMPLLALCASSMLLKWAFL